MVPLIRILRFFLLSLCAITMMSAMADDGNLLTLRDKCTALTEKADHRQALRVAGRLLHEARAAGNRNYEAYGLYYEGVSDILLGNNERGKERLDQALALALETENDTILPSIYNAMGIFEAEKNNQTLASDYFYRALKYAMKIKDDKRREKVEINLAHIYYIRRDTSGTELVREVYEKALARGNDNIAIPAGYYYACFLCLKGDNEMASHCLADVMGMAEKSNYKEMSSLYKLQAEICYHRGQLGSARMWLDKALEAQVDAQAATVPEIYLSMAQVAAAGGKYEESNAIAAKGERIASETGVYNILADFYALVSGNYEKMGNTAAALEYQKKHQVIADSIYHYEKERAIKEFTIKYSVDKREQELAYNREMLVKESQKNTILVVSIVILLLAAGVLAVMYRRQVSLYRAIAKQNRNALTRGGLLAPRVTEGNDSDDDAESAETQPDANPNDTDEDKKLLYQRICRLLEKDKVYTDSSLTRETLAKMAGSNRTYLSIAINKNAGVSFSQFINSYRIQEAVRVLSDPANADYPLKALASDLGFSSMTTFYKQFQSEVGMTPSAYRKTILSL